MRTLTKLLLMIGLALTVSTSAGATLTIGLVQTGGTYSASVGAQPGDTLVLNITWAVDAGDMFTLIDPALTFNGSVQSFNAAGSTETPAALMQGYASFAPIATGDIALVPPYLANGWEKANTTPVTAPCVYGPGGSCTSMGTAAFVLTGLPGLIAVEPGLGVPGGTTITDNNFNDIVGLSNLGTFTIVPEPTTASLLGLGLLGLTVAGRRRS